MLGYRSEKKAAGTSIRFARATPSGESLLACSATRGGGRRSTSSTRARRDFPAAARSQTRTLSGPACAWRYHHGNRPGTPPILSRSDPHPLIRGGTANEIRGPGLSGRSQRSRHEKRGGEAGMRERRGVPGPDQAQIGARRPNAGKFLPGRHGQPRAGRGETPRRQCPLRLRLPPRRLPEPPLSVHRPQWLPRRHLRLPGRWSRRQYSLPSGPSSRSGRTEAASLLS